jgi:hypothetical protein
MVLFLRDVAQIASMEALLASSSLQALKSKKPVGHHKSRRAPPFLIEKEASQHNRCISKVNQPVSHGRGK